MATKLFILNSVIDTLADTHLATNLTKLDGAASGWAVSALSTSRGTSTVNVDTNTVAGPTSGVESGSPRHWLSPPVAADVTISGAITGNLWASEVNMVDNVAINFVVDKVAAIDGAITQIVKSARTTEVNLTTRAVNNFTATPGAGVALNRGDRIRVRVFGDDAGVMGAGGSFAFSYSGPTDASDGDSYISLTETITFETTDPAGTQLFCRSTGAGINPGAANEMEMWTSRGGGSADLVTNTAAGWTAGIQVTDTGAGTTQEWYTKQLTAFTLGGKCLVNIRASESSSAANASLRAEVAICASDGTSPVVWGTASIVSSTGAGLEETGELGTEQARTAYVSGDDTSVTNGQRLRLRIYVEDSSFQPLVTGHTVTVSHNGVSAGAAGDTYLTLPQSVTEFTERPYIQTISRPGLYLRGPHMGPPVLIRQLSGEVVVVVVGTTVFIIDTSPAA